MKYKKLDPEIKLTEDDMNKGKDKLASMGK